MNLRLLALLATLLTLAGFAQARPADARGYGRGLTQVFTDVYVGPNETIDGDVNVIFGDAKIAGTVHGDCITVFGSCAVTDGGHVDGRINGVDNDLVRTLVPWAVGHDRGFAAFAEQDHRLFGKLLGSAIVVLVFLLFPLRMRVALDRVERHPGLSAAIGALAAVAIFPIGLVLLVTIIGIPLIPLEIAAVIAFIWIGNGAIALLVGRRLCELVMPAATPSPLVALIVGLVVVSAAQVVPFVGWAVTALVWLVGLGCAILSFVRSASLDASLHRVPAGPPMRRS
ncbi:MAG TPA: hypothetical protein VGD01_07280 [Candidatus Elarobacter sp.]